MVIETYLRLLRDELNNLQNYSEEKMDIYYEQLLSPSRELAEKSIVLSVLCDETITKIAFYEHQLYDLGFYDEEMNEKQMNQTLTGNC